MSVREVVLKSILENDIILSALAEEIPVVLQSSKDLESLTIKSIGRSYLGYDFESGVLYKLHSDVDIKRPYKYRWLSMWNSVSWTSIKGEKYWYEIENAIKAALKNDWKVIQVNGDVFKNILSFLEE